MSVILDVILAVLIVLSVITGIRRGFVRSLINIAGVFLSWFLAMRLCHPLGNMISERWVAPAWKNAFLEKLGEGAGEAIVNVEQLLQNVPEFFEKMLGTYNTSAAELEAALQSGAATGDMNAQAAELVVTPAAQTVSVVLAFVGILLVGLLVSSFLAWLIGKIFNLPVLRLFNKVGGAICGAAIGVGLAVLFAAAINYATPYVAQLQPDENGVAAADRTLLFKHFQHLDLAELLSKFNVALEDLSPSTQPATAPATVPATVTPAE
ncbi:MAG: CvpA family protein [Clostridia bacterium]|nr:CvpA family protein [Clostridia bacterium]